MYGLVNRGVRDLVIAAHGEEVWQTIADKAGVDASGFDELVNYDDAITYALVDAASETLQQSAEDILFAFGQHWVLYTGSDKWGYLFDLAGNDFVSFLQGLDNLHGRVEIAMQESRIPQFSVNKHDDHLILEYHSHREGLAPMVLGLLQGLQDKFDEQWSIEHVGYRARDGFDSFKLTNQAINDKAA